MVIWDAMLLPRLQVGALKTLSIGLVIGANVLPGTWAWIFQRSSSGRVALKVPVKLGSPMFRYLVTSFKWNPNGVPSSGWVYLIFASFILKSRIDEELENERRVVIYGFNLVVVSYSQRVLWYHLCSDQTRMDQVSVLRCHPWISNADTTQYFEGFIAE